MILKVVAILTIIVGVLAFMRGCATLGHPNFIYGGLIVVGIGILINIFRPRTMREYVDYVDRKYTVYAKCNNCGWQGSGQKFKKNSGECPYCGSDDFGVLKDRLPEKVKAHIKKKGW